MSHWEKFKRLYTAILIFISANAVATVSVFTVYTPLELQQLSGRMFALDLVKVIAIASATLLAYLGFTPKTSPPAP